MRKLLRFQHIHSGVKKLTLATAIRYFGWGLGETLIPVFLYQFAQSYAETGIISSVYSIGFLLVIPLLGLVQDHIPTRLSLLLGLCFYPLVGTGYFLAGFTGVVIFVVLARFFNGIGYALYSVGASTYIKRNSEPEHVALNSGFAKSIPNWAWVAAVVCSIPFIDTIPVHWLLFAIVPTHIIAFLVIWNLNQDKIIATTFSVMEIFKKYIAHMKEKILHHRHHAKQVHQLKHKGVYIVVIGNLVLNLVIAITSFLLPLYVFQNNKDIMEIVLMAIVSAIPAMLTMFFGNLVDKHPVKSFIIGFLSLFPLIVGLGFTTGYLLTLMLAFGIGLLVEIISIGMESITTQITPKSHFGSVTTLLSAIDDIGDMMGAIILGIGMDLLGIQMSLFTFAGLLGIFFVFAYFWRHHLVLQGDNSNREFSSMS